MSNNNQIMKVISTGQAIRDGLLESALKNENVIFMAQGVKDPSSVFGTLKGFDQYLSDQRLIEMPVSENGLIGIAIGASLSGQRPVVSLHRVEFALLAVEQIINNAAKIAFMSQGKETVPILIRLIVGRGWGQGPNHSQSLESIFGHIPGLQVIMPTYPEDAKGMIIAAVESNNPIISIENRWCHYIEGNVPNGHYLSNITSPKKIHEGNHFTIVSSSYMTLEAMMAAKILKKFNINIEVIDLRVVRPLDMQPIIASVKKTGTLMTVDVGWTMYGVGAEIVSRIATDYFNDLKIPPIRLGVANKPTPSSRGLLVGHYPDAVSIVTQICNKLKLDKKTEKEVIKLAQFERSKNPIDIPHPAFKGPF